MCVVCVGRGEQDVLNTLKVCASVCCVGCEGKGVVEAPKVCACFCVKWERRGSRMCSRGERGVCDLGSGSLAHIAAGW